MRDYQKGDKVYVFKNSIAKDLSWHHWKPGSELEILDPLLQKNKPNPMVEVVISQKDGPMVLVEDIRPVYWYVRIPNGGTINPIYKRVINYLNKIKLRPDKFAGDICPYYGYDGNTQYDNGVCGGDVITKFINNAIELTLEEWDRFNYDGLSSISNNSQSLQDQKEPFNDGEKLVVVSGVSIHGIQHGTEVYYVCTDLGRKRYPKDNATYALVEDKSGFRHSVRMDDLRQQFKQTITNNMTTIKLTRKQLISLYAELTCKDCRDVITIYLDSYPHALDDHQFTIKPAHLDRIKELSPEQKKILSRYFPLPEEEKTYKCGDRFQYSSGSPFILAQVESRTVNFINLDNGNRLGIAVKVKNIDNIKSSELKSLTNDPYLKLTKCE